MKTFLYLLGICLSFSAWSKGKFPIQLGEATVKDFGLLPGNPDTSTGAVIIAHAGEVRFDGNRLLQIYSEKKRVRIFNVKGYSAGEMVLPDIYTGSDRYEVVSISAYLHNIEDGKVHTLKLSKEDVYTDRIEKDIKVKKIAIPKVKPGSIIDIEYTIKMASIDIQDWNFQSEFPTLWSSYKMYIPQIFQYHEVLQQISSFDERYSENIKMNVDYFNLGIIDVEAKQYILKNIPPLYKLSEPNSPSRNIYLMSLQMVLNRISINYYEQDIFDTWQNAGKLLNKDRYLGITKRETKTLQSKTEPIIENTKLPEEKCKTLYDYVLKTYHNENSRFDFFPRSLHEIDSSKSVTEVERNWLLCHLLRVAEIDANPVLICTKSNGFPHPIYPIISRYNYVIVKVNLEKDTFYLDASKPEVGYKNLLADLINYEAKEITEDGAITLNMDPDRFVDHQIYFTQFLWQNDKMETQEMAKLGDFTSAEFRSKFHKSDSLTIAKDILEHQSKNTKVLKCTWESMHQPKENIALLIESTNNNSNADILYISPISNVLDREVFKSSKRTLPIQFPVSSYVVHTIIIDIPPNFNISELPQPITIDLDNGSCLFNYLIDTLNNQIRIKTEESIRRTFYTVNEYPSVKDYFSKIAARKEAVVVLKRKRA